MPVLDKATIECIFAAFMAKDIEAVLALFADDAVMIDPHYPVREMRGKAAIRQGLEWAFSNIERPGFTLRQVWADGDAGAVEVDTHHLFRGGMALRFPQVFVFDTRDGLIGRLQAYTPHGPPGIGGLLASATRVAWRLRGLTK
jgi:ketosteroid isomerase-like protein